MVQLPKLSIVDRKIASDVLGFGLFNLFLGIALFTYTARTIDFFIINDLLSYQFWGTLFFLTGLFMLIFYFANSWKHTQQMLIAGLTLKFFWLLALGVRQIENPGSSVFLILLFGLLAYFQVTTYLHFPDYRKAERWNSGRP